MNDRVSLAVSEQADSPQVTGSITSRPVALTIAGFDPSSGAGITADLKTFAAHSVYGVACISALTVQSTSTVRSVEPLAAALVLRTLDCLSADLSFSGVKIGMLGTGEVVGALTSFLRVERRDMGRQRVVLDPVFYSTSGKALLDAEGVRRLKGELLACVGWITPNLAELAALADMETVRREQVPQAAIRVQKVAAELGNEDLHVVVTGGHLERPDDFLLTSAAEQHWIPGEHIATNATHGTGCTFSSALLCRLIAGDTAIDAVTNAKAYVASALRSAYPVGKGKGPLNHFFALNARPS
jgi:hydroxymethylpyrimidine/phosphomethylpyrimidine kinase